MLSRRPARLRLASRASSTCRSLPGGPRPGCRRKAMCRLFGLHAGTGVVTATFWLLDAPDNLTAQSRRNPDGTGLGVFDGLGQPQVRKQPIAAWQDAEFATEAHDMTGTTFIPPVRYATTGSHDVVNTHPFFQDGRLFAEKRV